MQYTQQNNGGLPFVNQLYLVHWQPTYFSLFSKDPSFNVDNMIWFLTKIRWNFFGFNPVYGFSNYFTFSNPMSIIKLEYQWFIFTLNPKKYNIHWRRSKYHSVTFEATLKIAGQVSKKLPSSNKRKRWLSCLGLIGGSNWWVI